MSRNASGLPDISRPTSNPSFMPSSSGRSSIVRSRTSTASVAPIFLASASRYGFTSVTTTCRAPACRATSTAMIPIGPAPVISTSSPSTSNWSAVCTALPNGSKIACTSRGMLGSCDPDVGHRQRRGTRRTRRGGSRRSPLVSLQRCRRPARQLRQRPQTTCPSPLTISPTWKSLTFEPTSTISPTNSCPTTIGTGIVCCAQASHS